MDSLMQRQQKRFIMEVRSRNNAAKHELDQKLSRLDTDLRNYEYLHDKNIRALKSDMKEAEDGDLSDNDSEYSEFESYYRSFPDVQNVTKVLGIHSASPFPVNRQSTGPSTSQLGFRPSAMTYTTSRSKHQTEKGKYCKFGATSSGCFRFPCLIPRQYNSLGFNIRQGEDQRQERFSTSSLTTVDARDHFLSKLEANSVRRPLKCDMVRTSQREKALRRMVQDMRRRNAAKKPTDYSVHYGAPLPVRKLTSVPRFISTR